jgi:hypothetical protein
MTSNEFAELSLTYILKYTQDRGVGNLDQFADYLNTRIVPLLPDISTEESSYSYLESQSCANISIMNVDLMQALKSTYGGIFAKGLTKDEIVAHLPDGKKDIFEGTTLVIPCLIDATKFQFHARSRDDFHKVAAQIALSKDELNNLWNALEGTMWSKEELIENLKTRVPSIGELFRLWNETPIERLTLTSVGIAIAHANSVRVTKLDADLSIWIK